MNVKQQLQEKWELLAEKFNARQQRERILLFACVVVAIYMVWDFSVAQPMAKKREALEARFTAAEKNLNQISAEEQVLVKALTNDPGAAKRREIVRLETQLETLDKELEALSVGLLPAEQLPKVLHDVLRHSSSLKLIGMKKNKAEELALDNFATETITEEQKAIIAVQGAELEPDQNIQRAGVYKHSVTLSLEGSYFQVRDYLKQLERLPWKLYWNELDYHVSLYPKAVVTLEVYTLSTEKGFLGG